MEKKQKRGHQEGKPDGQMERGWGKQQRKDERRGGVKKNV